MRVEVQIWTPDEENDECSYGWGHVEVDETGSTEKTLHVTDHQGDIICSIEVNEFIAGFIIGSLSP